MENNRGEIYKVANDTITEVLKDLSYKLETGKYSEEDIYGKLDSKSLMEAEDLYIILCKTQVALKRMIKIVSYREKAVDIQKRINSM